MNKQYTSLGLMSGTSGDGIDASIIKSDGNNSYNLIKDRYYQYDEHIQKDIHSLKERIQNINDLKKLSEKLNILERKITLFHAEIIQKITKDISVDIIGFHGQTFYHSPSEKISKQLGDAKLLSQLVKKDIIYDFRSNDIANGGEGAPLTAIFHKLIATHYSLKLPLCILNIGGISNITIIDDPINLNYLFSRDIGPGNCLIDSWVRNNSNEFFDKDGTLALRGTKNEIIFEQAQELFANRPKPKKKSLDINDFDISFARGLSLEDGATTLTDFTASIIGSELSYEISNLKQKCKILVCGGGRKNKNLIEKIKLNSLKDLIIDPIDAHGIDGDFIESQAFAYLAIRSMLKLPISFPKTTGCKTPCSGGKLIKFK